MDKQQNLEHVILSEFQLELPLLDRLCILFKRKVAIKIEIKTDSATKPLKADWYVIVQRGWSGIIHKWLKQKFKKKDGKPVLGQN